jgi:esterase/lipase superfamily enzyme
MRTYASLVLCLSFATAPIRLAAATGTVVAFAGTITSPPSQPGLSYLVSLYLGDASSDPNFDVDRKLVASTESDVDGNFIIVVDNLPPAGAVTIRAKNPAQQLGGQSVLQPRNNAWPQLSPKIAIKAAPISDPLFGLQTNTYAYQTMYFVTDRAANGGTFGNTAAALNTPSAGTFTANVALGSGQAIPGNCGLAGSDWKCDGGPVLNDDAYIKNVSVASTGDGAHNFLNSALSPPSVATVMLFVHGFNNSFEQGAQAAARVSFLMEPRPHLTLYYSWPSAGKVLGYPADEKSSDLSAQANLEWVLGLLADAAPHAKIVLVAHSMGANALATALDEWAKANPDRRDVFADLTVFAGDVDENLRGLYQPDITRVVSRIKIYSNKNDQALHASTCLTGDSRQRIGQIVTWSTPITGFDATPFASTDDFGHGYLDSSTTVAMDWNHWTTQNQPSGQVADIRRLGWLQDGGGGIINADQITVTAICAIFPKIEF